MNNVENNSMESSQINEMTLAEIVSRNYKAARVFEKYDLDFCCKGNRIFEEACSDKGVNTAEILEELTLIESSVSSADNRFSSWELDFLVDYIINIHHRYVRETIPVISAHSQKVVAAHGKNHPELDEIAKIFTIIYKDLRQHLIKEEEILFPYIKNLVRVKNKTMKYEAPYFGKIANPIKMMESEHEAAGDGLFEIRRLSSNYFIPEDACNTYAIFYKELKEFEEDLHKHVHLENNILFPKAIELENMISSGKIR